MFAINNQVSNQELEENGWKKRNQIGTNEVVYTKEAETIIFNQLSQRIIIKLSFQLTKRV